MSKIKMNCVQCAEEIVLGQQEEKILGQICINLPGVLCPNCVDNLLDEVPDPPGLIMQRDIDLGGAVSVLSELAFIRPLDKSVLFFCELFKGHPEIYDAGAVRLHREGFLKEAYQILDRGIHEAESKDALHLEKAAFLGMENRNKEALESLDNVMNQEIDRYSAIKGNILKGLGRWDEAAVCWQKGMHRDRDDKVLWNNLGYYRLHIRKDFIPAADHYAAAAKIFPDHPPFFAYLGDSYYFQGLFKKALTSYDYALKLDQIAQFPSLVNDIHRMMKCCNGKISKVGEK